MDEIADDEIILGISHRVYHGKLVFDALAVFALGMRPGEDDIASRGAPVKPFKDERAQVRLRALAVFRLEAGEKRPAEIEIEIAHIGDPCRILHGLLVIPKQAVHLGGGFEIVFVRFKAQRTTVGETGVRLYAHKYRLRLGVRFFEIMHVVRGDERYAGAFVYAIEPFRDSLLIRYAVILKLEKEIPVAEDRVQLSRVIFRFLALPRGDEPRDRSGETRRKSAQAFAVRREKIEVDPRLCVKAVGERLGHKIYEIPVARFVFYEQDEVGAFKVEIVFPVRHRARGDVDLAADDRLDPRLFASLIEVDRAVHNAVVRDRDRSLTRPARGGGDLRNAARAVEQAELAVEMEMDKIGVSRRRIPFRFSRSDGNEGRFISHFPLSFQISPFFFA